MGAFFSLRRTLGAMALAAAASYAVMRIHSAYLAACTEGQYSEIFFAVQTILLVIQCILGLMLVGGSIFYRPSGAGMSCVCIKILLVLVMTALSLFGIWLVAEFGAANAAFALKIIPNI